MLEQNVRFQVLGSATEWCPAMALSTCPNFVQLYDIDNSLQNNANVSDPPKIKSPLVMLLGLGQFMGEDQTHQISQIPAISAIIFTHR